jgi:hypothetical protein
MALSYYSAKMDAGSKIKHSQQHGKGKNGMTDHETNTVGSKAPVVKRTPNHIYEHCSSIAVMGMKAEGENMRLVLQMGRDITELSDGSTKGQDIFSVIRHTFATLTIDKAAALQLANGILKSYKNETILDADE